MSNKSKVQSPKPKVQGTESEVLGLESGVLRLKSLRRRFAATEYLSRFLCAGLALALMATGCTGPRALRDGRAITTHEPAGVIEQTLVQH